MSTTSRKKTARRQARKTTTTTRSADTPGVAPRAEASQWDRVRVAAATSTVRPQPPKALAAAGPAPAVSTPAPDPAATPVADGAPDGGGCAASVSEAGPHGLAATYWLDAGTSGPPFSVNVRFVGTRVGVDGAPEQGDHFDQVERVDAITPGQGRVAITTRPSGINPGEWRVTATPVRYFDARHTATSAAAAKIGPRPPRRDLTAHTRLVPLVHGPGVRLAMWPALVGLGVVVAVVLQAVLLARAHVDATAAVAISLGASIVGYLSAKTWYLVQHRKPLRTFIHAGACIQGFLVGAIATMALALAVSGIPVGTFLDATTPGLFFGMAIGRPGCFLTGCCVGRPTTSRWGLWSSDRRVGIRRIPIQLVEAAVALLIGLVTLALALAADPPFAGAVFLGAIAAYTLCRQVLFPFRAEPRATSLGRTLALGASALVLLVDVAVAALA